MRLSSQTISTERINFSRIFGVFIIVLFLGIILMVAMIIRAALTGPSAPNSTYDFNLDQYQTQVDSNPANVAARIGLAQTYLMAKKYDEGKAQLLEVFRYEGRPGIDQKKISIAHFLLGQLYRIQKNPKAGLVEMKKAIKLDNSNDSAYFELGELYLTSKNYKAAAQAFKKVLTLDPVAADVHYKLGVIYSKLGNKAGALKEFKICLKYMPGDKQTLQAMALLSGGK